MSGDTQDKAEKKGQWIFFVLLLLIGCIAIWYSLGSESMGIEERFSSALGISHEGEEPDEGSGFALEGSPVLYILVLGLLGLTCWVVYRKFGA
jgi:hypothetical protein